MNLKEVIERIESGETEIDPTIELFKDSFVKAQEIAEPGLVVFRDQGNIVQSFAPETTGLYIEIASIETVTNVRDVTENPNTRANFSTGIQRLRMSAWEKLFLRLPEGERNIFTDPKSCTAYTRTAQSGATDILTTRFLSGEELQSELGQKFSSKMKMMQGIRLGKISF